MITIVLPGIVTGLHNLLLYRGDFFSASIVMSHSLHPGQSYMCHSVFIQMLARLLTESREMAERVRKMRR